MHCAPPPTSGHLSEETHKCHRLAVTTGLCVRSIPSHFYILSPNALGEQNGWIGRIGRTWFLGLEKALTQMPHPNSKSCSICWSLNSTPLEVDLVVTSSTPDSLTIDWKDTASTYFGMKYSKMDYNRFLQCCCDVSNLTTPPAASFLICLSFRSKASL